MLPWNPPSAFSFAGDHQQQQQSRYGYSDAPGSQMQMPPHPSSSSASHPPSLPGGPPSSSQLASGGQQPSVGAGPPHPHPHGPPGGAIPPPPTNHQAAYPPMTLAATLHFLQSEHRRYARDRNEWEIERAEMRARIALLEGEKRGNEAALKSLGRRCKMLEMALRGERSKFLSTTNALGGTPSVSGTASPIPGGTPALAKDAPSLLTTTATAGAIPAHKLAALQKEGVTGSAPATPGGEAPHSAPMAASSSTPGQGQQQGTNGSAVSAAPAASSSSAPPASTSSSSSVPAHARGDSLSVPAPTSGPNGLMTHTGGASGTASLGVRDPRGKARSREYLKQCLQEITYLTSSATLNPLAAHSYAAPSVPRPRKVLPDQVPPTTMPGVINFAAPPPGTGTGTGTGAQGHGPAGGEVVPASSGAAAEPATKSAVPAPAPVSAPAPAPATAARSDTNGGKPAPPRSEMITAFPSDPPSAFVPLRRQISQPGQQGAAPTVASGRASLPTPVPQQQQQQQSPAGSAGAADLAGPPSQDQEADGAAAAAAALDAEIAKLAEAAPATAPEANEDKPDEVSAALAAEKGAALASPPRRPGSGSGGAEDPLTVGEERDALENPSPASAATVAEDDSSEDDGRHEEAEAEADAPPEPVKLNAQELALQAVHAAPEANEEKPDDAVALIATAGEDGVDEEDGAGAAEHEDERADEAKSDPLGLPVRTANTLGRRGPGAGGRAARNGAYGTLSRGRDQRRGLASVFAHAASMSGSHGLDGDAAEATTAIFAGPVASGAGESGPEAAWRRKLQEAGRRAYPHSGAGAGARAADEDPTRALGGERAGGDPELRDMRWELDATDDGDDDDEQGPAWKGEGQRGTRGRGKKGGKVEEMEGPVFRPRTVLRSHLDAVRVVACVEVDGQELVVTGGDDYVVKLWRDAVGPRCSRIDIEAVVTLRGHTGPITALAVSRPGSTTDESVLFSASLDSTVRIWAFPAVGHATYDPVDPSLAVGVLEPEADAIWGLAALPKDRLACITADGSIQVWDWRAREQLASWTLGTAETGKGSLRKRGGSPPTPTALAAVDIELEEGHGVRTYLVVAFQNAVVVVFDPQDGREVRRIQANETSDETAASQINAVAVQPALSLLATAHEDRYLRIFDLRTGQCLVSTLAHLDGVTSAAFSPSPVSPSDAALPQGVAEVTLASASHDTSLRIWTVRVDQSSGGGEARSTMTCIQEATSHRIKGAEGVLSIAFARTSTAIVTAAADGTARVWEQSS